MLHHYKLNITVTLRVKKDLEKNFALLRSVICHDNKTCCYVYSLKGQFLWGIRAGLWSFS